MKSTNPIFRDSVLSEAHALTERPMTVEGTMNKLLLLSIIMLVAAAAVYYQFSLQHFDYVQILFVAGCIVGLISAIVIAFNQKTTPYLAPIYAFSQGAAVSAMSCFFEAMYSGIVLQAVSITFLTVLTMGILYKSRIIQATDKLRRILMTAGIAVFAFYLVSFILSFFNVNVAYFTSSSPLAITVNVIIALVAAFYLILDFDFIEKGVNAPLPSNYEWYGAFGLLVTILWLYVEILRLLARLRDR